MTIKELHIKTGISITHINNRLRTNNVARKKVTKSRAFDYSIKLGEIKRLCDMSNKRGFNKRGFNKRRSTSKLFERWSTFPTINEMLKQKEITDNE